jgi:hypothetical protein
MWTRIRYRYGACRVVPVAVAWRLVGLRPLLVQNLLMAIVAG